MLPTLEITFQKDPNKSNRNVFAFDRKNTIGNKTVEEQVVKSGGGESNWKIDEKFPIGIGKSNG